MLLMIDLLSPHSLTEWLAFHSSVFKVDAVVRGVEGTLEQGRFSSNAIHVVKMDGTGALAEKGQPARRHVWCEGVRV